MLAKGHRASYILSQHDLAIMIVPSSWLQVSEIVCGSLDVVELPCYSKFVLINPDNYLSLSRSRRC